MPKINIVLAIDDTAVVNLQVTGTCNNNGVCEFSLGETELGCAADCGCNSNGVCESGRGETKANCAVDCVFPENQNISSSGYIKNVEVKNITINSATITWQTEKNAVCELYWGNTADYEKELISETKFFFDHSVNLVGLQVASVYHFKILCSDESNIKDGKGDFQFKTLSVLDNVLNFKAIGDDGKVFLNWQNPQISDFDRVKIIRNDNFFPLSTDDGVIIYEGINNFYIDTDVINGQDYFYANYVFDKLGNHSSGALAYALPQVKGLLSAKQFPEFPQVTPQENIEWKLSLKDFDFYSEGKKLEIINSQTVEVKSGKQLIISIDYKKIHGKAVFLTAGVDNNGMQSLYSFNLDEGKNVYSVAFVLSEKEGDYPLTITLFNEKNESVYQVKGEISVYKEGKITLKESIWIKLWKNLVFQIIFWLLLIIILIILIILLIFFIFFVKKRKEEDDDEEKKKIENYNK